MLASPLLGSQEALGSPCQHDSVMDEIYQKYPHAHTMSELLRVAQEQHFTTRRLTKRADEPLPRLRIPVVFHVLHSATQGNLTMAQISQEMEYVNRWFNATNGRYDQATEYFRDVIAEDNDFQLEFVLATQLPDGSAFDGVIYKEVDQSLIDNRCPEGQLRDSTNGKITMVNCG